MDHLLGIPLPFDETYRRAEYETQVVPLVRGFLSAQEWGHTVRCLITCYGVPLRLGPRRPNESERRRVEQLRKLQRETLDAIQTVLAQIRAADVKPQDRPPTDENAPTSRTPPQRKLDGKSLERLYAEYVDEQTKLAIRHRQLAGRELLLARQTTFGFVQRAEGKTGLVQRTAVKPGDVDPGSVVRINQMKKRIVETMAHIAELLRRNSTPEEFDRAMPLILDIEGLYGVANALQRRVALLTGDQTESSFDSELALVLWEDYDLRGWQANALREKPSPSETGQSGGDSSPRTLMVGRLDGPTPAIVRRMIDAAVDTERRGLRGTFYVDARGIKSDEGFMAFDRDLIDLAHIVRTQTEMPVVLNFREETFQPGDCPNAALYCGWYSLAHYVDAFDFVPGAVGVHIASFELISLNAPTKRYWCKELLADGVAATFGATSEPYLQSFPLPTEFFGALLTGKYTLVEAFCRTKPYCSWKLSLLGDPLYNPFKNNPQLPLDWATTKKSVKKR